MTTRTWSKDYYDNFKTYWILHNAYGFIDTNDKVINNIFTGDIVKLTVDKYLEGTTDTTRFIDKSYVLGYVRKTDNGYRIRQFSNGYFYKYSLTEKKTTLKAITTTYSTEADKLLPIYFYNLVNNKEMFNWNDLVVVGNVYETANNYAKEQSKLSWH